MKLIITLLSAVFFAHSLAHAQGVVGFVPEHGAYCSYLEDRSDVMAAPKNTHIDLDWMGDERYEAVLPGGALVVFDFAFQGFGVKHYDLSVSLGGLTVTERGLLTQFDSPSSTTIHIFGRLPNGRFNCVATATDFVLPLNSLQE